MLHAIKEFQMKILYVFQKSITLLFFYNYDDLDWATNELTSTGFEGGMARAPCRDGICSGANSGIYQRPPHFGVGVFGIHSGDSVDNYRYGPLHIHEVTHSVVASQWIDNSRNPQCRVLTMLHPIG